jgi:hypothetical protein
MSEVEKPRRRKGAKISRRFAFQKSPNISPAQGRLAAETLFSAACLPLNRFGKGE